MRKVADAARAAGLEWSLARQGSRHEWWRCGATGVAIPRHGEIAELTALSIFRELAIELGEGWWRR
jgi:hypothetical protein